MLVPQDPVAVDLEEQHRAGSLLAFRKSELHGAPPIELLAIGETAPLVDRRKRQELNVCLGKLKFPFFALSYVDGHAGDDPRVLCAPQRQLFRNLSSQFRVV